MNDIPYDWHGNALLSVVQPSLSGKRTATLTFAPVVAIFPDVITGRELPLTVVSRWRASDIASAVTTDRSRSRDV
jgi:hypothetical protein